LQLDKLTLINSFAAIVDVYLHVLANAYLPICLVFHYP